MNRFYLNLNLLTVFESQVKANKQNKCKIFKNCLNHMLEFTTCMK